MMSLALACELKTSWQCWQRSLTFGATPRRLQSGSCPSHDLTLSSSIIQGVTPGRWSAGGRSSFYLVGGAQGAGLLLQGLQISCVGKIKKSIIPKESSRPDHKITARYSASRCTLFPVTALPLFSLRLIYIAHLQPPFVGRQETGEMSLVKLASSLPSTGIIYQTVCTLYCGVIPRVNRNKFIFSLVYLPRHKCRIFVILTFHIAVVAVAAASDRQILIQWLESPL